jgi:3'(2'), 5'-bisphosphate nucleotidase
MEYFNNFASLLTKYYMVNWESIDIEQINRIALDAGRKILEVYVTADFTKIVDFKSNNSPLTLADKESHILIDRELKKLYPEIPVLSEEGRNIPYEERKNWKYFWLVDPLDGTKEFIKRNGEFTVNIALIENGKPVLGVIYAPAFERLYYAKKGEGAFKREKGKTLKLSTVLKKENWIAIGSRSHSSPEEAEILKKYPVTNATSIGSSLKFCLLAEGQADIYYRHGPTMEWDTAAGQIILECSGGEMKDAKGNSFIYNKEILTNGGFLCIAKRN